MEHVRCEWCGRTTVNSLSKDKVEFMRRSQKKTLNKHEVNSITFYMFRSICDLQIKRFGGGRTLYGSATGRTANNTPCFKFAEHTADMVLTIVFPPYGPSARFGNNLFTIEVTSSILIPPSNSSANTSMIVSTIRLHPIHL
jgi:hypothetical protein